jgi:hypothetical protein
MVMREIIGGEGYAMAAPESRAPDPQIGATGWRQSKWLAVAELVVVALVFCADFKHRIFSSKTPYLLLFA